MPIKTCTNCGSERVYFDQEFGFYKCETCSTVWASDEDDPDYDELIEEAKFHNNKYIKELYPDTPYPDTPDEAT